MADEARRAKMERQWTVVVDLAVAR